MACKEFASLSAAPAPTTAISESSVATPRKPYQGFKLPPRTQVGLATSCIVPLQESQVGDHSKCKSRGIPALWTIWLLVLGIAAVSTLPTMGISIVQIQGLGNTLLEEAAEQQFNVIYMSIQAALDEGDYWGSFMDGWLRHQPPPHTQDVTDAMQLMMLTWLSTVAKRIDGFCSAFVNERGPAGWWQICAARVRSNGVTEYHWEYTPNSTAALHETRAGQYVNVSDTVASWDAHLAKPEFSWADGRLEWDQPSALVEGDQAITEISQHRMVKVGTAAVVNHFWMRDTDWAQVIRENLDASLMPNPTDPPIAFLFSSAGQLIASTCGTTHRRGQLLMASESDCEPLRQAHAALDQGGHLATGSAFYRATLPAGTYLLGLRRIRTTRSGATPYFLATAYPCSAVDQPVRWTVLLLGISTACSLLLTIVIASVVTSLLIARPLRDVALALDRCVELDTAAPLSHRRSPIREVGAILDSLSKVKQTLQAVTKFVPVPVVQRSLRLGEPITMSMTPTEASVLFLDIQDFTHLTETSQTGHLVTSVAAFFERLSDAIVLHHGIIDKYIGDCMMAFWNTPLCDPQHQLHACEAALACILAMEDHSPHLLPLKGRIGLEAGPVYAGLFGSRHRMNYTVVGDAVNVASRLEALNKACGTRILLGPCIHAAVAERVKTRQLPPMDIRGKSERLVVYELWGLAAPQPPDSPHSPLYADPFPPL